MTRFLLRLLITAVALWIAALLIPGIDYHGGWFGLAAMALIFGLVNATLGTALRVLSCPLILLTLGLFALVINGALLMLASGIGSVLGVQFEVAGCGSALLGALVISLVSLLLTMILPDPGESQSRA